MTTIILASSSPYRQELLNTLGLAFEAHAPDVDETRLTNEGPRDLVARLAEKKARALASRFSKALIIGSDQVALCDGQVLTKPITHERAFEQLRLCSGKSVEFSTGLCLLNSETGSIQCEVEPFVVRFRELSDEQIHGYLYKEEPYDCAGSFKCEGLGVALFERFDGRDQNALVGLPLILLVKMLGVEGVDPLV